MQHRGHQEGERPTRFSLPPPPPLAFPFPFHSLRSCPLLQAYRLLAKQHHPDKGGDPAAFARLQAAFEVLIDPVRRQVYDTWAKELQFRCAHHRVQLNTKQHCSVPRVQAHLLAQSQQPALISPAACLRACRYVRTAAAAGGAGMGGEGILLDGFENMGLHCDPATQVHTTLCLLCCTPPAQAGHGCLAPTVAFAACIPAALS